MISSVAPTATGSAIIILVSCAARTPNAIVNWFIATSLPLIWAGDISAIYTGDTFEAMPMPIPPIILKIINEVNELKAPVPRDVMMKRKAENRRGSFLPYLSVIFPDTAAPIMQPNSALLIAKP